MVGLVAEVYWEMSIIRPDLTSIMLGVNYRPGFRNHEVSNIKPSITSHARFQLLGWFERMLVGINYQAWHERIL
jgi:hypothetical protein